MNENWNQIFSAQHHPYRDRHWLWQLLPELFPLPPTQLPTSLKSKIYACPLCKILYNYPETANCPHTPTWASAIDLKNENLNQLSVPFAPLSTPIFSVLDIGCGTGATCFPLLEKNGGVRVTAFDFSAQAVSNAKSRRFFDDSRLEISVNDATKFDLGQFDFALLVFVLSSISEVRKVILEVKNSIQNGIGVIVDYAEQDYRVQRRSGEKFEFGTKCERSGDGTLLIGFDVDKLAQLIQDEGMFIYEKFQWVKVEKNRKTGQTFERVHFLLKFGVQQFKNE